MIGPIDDAAKARMYFNVILLGLGTVLGSTIASIIMSVAAVYTASRVNHELLLTERINQRFHTKSIDDREFIKSEQQGNIQRIEAIEKAIKELSGK